MDTCLKCKGLQKYTKTTILDLTEDHERFFIDGKKYEVVGVITTYISWEIRFHTSGIDFSHSVWNKLNSIFDKIDKSQVMQTEKELISLDLNSFENIEDYMDRVKEMQLKLGECGRNFLKKDGGLIEMVLVNLRTP